MEKLLKHKLVSCGKLKILGGELENLKVSLILLRN